MQLDQVVAIITGGAGGFGKAFADRILAANGQVLLTDVGRASLEAVGQEFQAKYGNKNVAWMQQDVTDPSSFDRVFDYAATCFGKPVNCLINNAGIAGDMSFFAEDAPTSWDKVIDIDLSAVVRGTQVALQKMKHPVDGTDRVVVNVASVAGLEPVPFVPVYAAAKSGVVGFTRSCYLLKQHFGVRVVALCPAFADTPMGRLAVENAAEAVQRMGLMKVEDVTNGLVRLLQDEDNCGRMIRVTKKACEYYRFPGDHRLYPQTKL